MLYYQKVVSINKEKLWSLEMGHDDWSKNMGKQPL